MTNPSDRLMLNHVEWKKSQAPQTNIFSHDPAPKNKNTKNIWKKTHTASQKVELPGRPILPNLLIFRWKGRKFWVRWCTEQTKWWCSIAKLPNLPNKKRVWWFFNVTNSLQISYLQWYHHRRGRRLGYRRIPSGYHPDHPGWSLVENIQLRNQFWLVVWPKIWLRQLRDDDINPIWMGK